MVWTSVMGGPPVAPATVAAAIPNTARSMWQITIRILSNSWRGPPGLQSGESSRLSYYRELFRKAEMTLGSADLAARATIQETGLNRRLAPVVK